MTLVYPVLGTRNRDGSLSFDLPACDGGSALYSFDLGGVFGDGLPLALVTVTEEP